MIPANATKVCFVHANELKSAIMNEQDLIKPGIELEYENAEEELEEAIAQGVVPAGMSKLQYQTYYKSILEKYEKRKKKNVELQIPIPLFTKTYPKTFDDTLFWQYYRYNLQGKGYAWALGFENK